MLRIYHLLLVLLTFALSAAAGDYKLINGNTLTGEPASMNEDGLVVRLDIGGFSERVAWGQLTQETLKELAKIPAAREMVEPFIEVPASERIKRKEIVIKEVPRVERPAKVRGIIAGLTQGSGLVFLLLLLAANIYVGYEIAVFKGRAPAIVCGVSAVLPIAGPILFLALPSAYAASGSNAEPEPAAADQLASPLGGGSAAPASGLSIAAAHKAPGATSTPGLDLTLYTRGETTFNRRFFEAKYPGLFRVVPVEAEKDLVLAIKTAKNDYIARRISRISANEMHLQLLKSATEVAVPFSEILQAQVRHKDARA